MALNLNKLVLQYLQARPDQRFTARQIAQWIFDTFPKECEEKRKKSTATVQPMDSNIALVRQISAEISTSRPRLQKNQPNFKTTEDRPRLYYYSAKSDDDEVRIVQSDVLQVSGGDTDCKKLSEHDLYPLLSAYLSSELGLHSKRIDEKTSSNTKGKGGNHWLFPDLVAMENLSADWHSEIKEFSKLNSDRWTRLWSFEVKILINRANVRECFFQAVSNSSWANFGYLVAMDIRSDTLKELRILNALHGIGLIHLNSEDPSESTILIPARESKNVDWDTANRLAVENPDFVGFIEAVKHFYQTGKVKPSDWEKV